MRKACLPIAAQFLLAVLLAAWSAFSSPTAGAAEAPSIIIVLDGSGSMWGRMEGQRESKLVMAREGVGRGLAKLAQGTRVGVLSFGHRRGGDCSDTEVLVEPAPLDIERVMSPLERLNPRGRGPITKALGEAIPLLGPQSAPARVVVIHDGADNCQQDPCSILGNLKAAHSHAQIDVVSIGVSREEAETMACLPRSTGGRHYRVSAVADVDAAITEAIGRPAEPVPASAAASQGRATEPESARASRPAAAAPGGMQLGTRPGLQLWTTLVKGGPALAAQATWRVRRAGEKGPPLWEGKSPAPLLVLPSGTYEVEATVGLLTRSAVTEAAEGTPRSLAIVLDAGMLALSEAGPARSMLEDAVVTLARVESKGPGDAQILRQVEPELAVPPGNYLVSVTSGALRIERPVGIVAGERISIANSLNLGALELAATAVSNGPQLDDTVFIVYEDDPDAPQGRREVARSAAAAPRFKLPAGTYYVVARRSSVEARDRVSVRTGEVERRTMVLDAGRVSVSVKVAGGRFEGEGPVVHRLERLDAQPPEIVTASGTTALLEVAAGHYRLESRVGLGNVRSEREIRLKAGELERIAIEYPAGGARFQMLDRTSGKPLPDISFEVRDRGGRLVWASRGSEPRALLLAGRYTVRAEGRGLTVEQAFDVASGDERLVEVSPR